MKSLKENPPDIKEKFLLYGEPKTGKTFAAFTAPRPIYALLLGPPNEINTTFSPDFVKAHGLDDIYYDAVSESMGPRGVFETATGFDEACDALDSALSEAAEKNIQTIVIDNMTVLLDYMMNKAIEYGRSGKESKALQNLRKNGIFIPADYDYQSQMSLTGQFIDWIFNLPFHIVLVCHEHQTYESDRATQTNKLIACRPLFTGKDRVNQPRLFDNVWRFTSEGSGKARKYTAQTDGSSGPLVIAGTRVGGVIPRYYSNVDLTWAINKLQSTKDSATNNS